MKKRRITDPDARNMSMRLRWIQHSQHVTSHVCPTCLYFGVSRSLFYYWMQRYRESGEEGLYSRSPDPRPMIHRTPPEVVSMILQIRRENNDGALRTSWYLQQHDQISVSNVTIQRLFRTHGVPRVTARRLARLHKPPAQASAHPGDHLQLDVKCLPKLGREHTRDDQFTAIDACTR